MDNTLMDQYETNNPSCDGVDRMFKVVNKYLVSNEPELEMFAVKSILAMGAQNATQSKRKTIINTNTIQNISMLSKLIENATTENENYLTKVIDHD